MRRRPWTLSALLLLPALLAGCLGGQGLDAGVDDAPAAGGFPRCEHPWPCADGREWPADLAPPGDGFALAEVAPLRAPMEDEVQLDGAAWLPDVPEGVRVPVVLWVTPYAGHCRPYPCEDAPAESEEFEALFDFLWKDGYAAAMFNLRGTGLSGGCFDFYGAQSQRDMAQLVEWLAAQPWSNGRVGMWGISAMGTTPWMAAIGAPPSLKAIAPSGIISDLYLNRMTPQGAPSTESGAFGTSWGTRYGLAPPGGAFTGSYVQDWPGMAARVAQNQPERVCEGVQEWETEALASQLTDERSHAFWEERRLVKDFANVTAAVLVQHGFLEGGHAFQDDAIWPTLENAPRRMLLGQWGHELTPDEQLAGYPGGNLTHDVLLTWFDFWLKGLGEPPRVGVVDYQVENGAWRESAAWPPAESRAEVLHLADGALQPDEGAGGTLLAAQTPSPETWAGRAAGQLTCVEEELGARLVYASEPVAQEVLVAGNAMAYLELTSDAEGGMLALDLFALDADGACRHFAAHGAADLRFHQGNARAEPFPVGEPTWVRVDLWSAAFRLAEGDRLLLVLTGGGTESERTGQAQYAPRLEVSGASHLVLPVVDGTLGGSEPALGYPPRPRV